ncbi:hypothetical protein [Actinomadura sp. 6N118]|uniref:hypothetical protein n=1 Tax=Actinomadura sp. 6N118 TaxID=3375151 RepID=UPI0037AC9E4C
MSWATAYRCPGEAVGVLAAHAPDPDARMPPERRLWSERRLVARTPSGGADAVWWRGRRLVA